MHPTSRPPLARSRNILGRVDLSRRSIILLREPLLDVDDASRRAVAAQFHDLTISTR